MIWVLVFGIGITIATVRLRYAVIANTLKWLALILVVCAVAAIDVRPDWHAVLRATVKPNLPHRRDAWATLVAILGTTISPYLCLGFHWDYDGGYVRGSSRDVRGLAQLPQFEGLGVHDFASLDRVGGMGKESHSDAPLDIAKVFLDREPSGVQRHNFAYMLAKYFEQLGLVERPEDVFDVERPIDTSNIDN
jgi:hypothetical protein